MYDETPNDVIAANEKRRRMVDLTSSLGIAIKEEDGMVRDVILGLPAASAGIGPGMKIVAVNGRRFTRALLETAITEAKSGGRIELLVENADFFRTHTVEYRGGLRYPHLVRVEGKADRLAEVLAPKAEVRAPALSPGGAAGDHAAGVRIDLWRACLHR